MNEMIFSIFMFHAMHHLQETPLKNSTICFKVICIGLYVLDLSSLYSNTHKRIFTSISAILSEGLFVGNDCQASHETSIAAGVDCEHV